MTDSKENRVSVKIFDSTHELLKDEKTRIWKTHRQKVDFADLIAPAVTAYLGTPEADRQPKTTRHAGELDLLAFVLDHGTKEHAEWITGNLKTFADAIRTGMSPVEQRLIEEFRRSGHDKRNKILGAAAVIEDLGPEVMPNVKGSGSRSPDSGSSAPGSRSTVTPAPSDRRVAGKSR